MSSFQLTALLVQNLERSFSHSRKLSDRKSLIAFSNSASNSILVSASWRTPSLDCKGLIPAPALYHQVLKVFFHWVSCDLRSFSILCKVFSVSPNRFR